MTKIAVILAGCGHQDGSEIREAVITLLALDHYGAEVQCFAPNRPQVDVINHMTSAKKTQERNILEEAARIARGNIKELGTLKAEDFDGLIMPGGFGMAKNFSTMLTDPDNVTAKEDIKAIILGFHKAGKPIGAMCIAPIVVAAALGGGIKPHLTVGEYSATLANLGATQEVCESEQICVDNDNRLVSCSAYMRDDKLGKIGDGIAALVMKVIEMAKKGKTYEV
ncbi:MAG: isoprenoid biosynthesis glyoxalase ElbB [Proteobacteria bacterium]|nr:isoprenoid biosynthesis glyoxalase ElbB [Pseudomonadota bacterium]